MKIVTPKKKRLYDNTARALKAANIPPLPLKKGAWQLEKERNTKLGGDPRTTKPRSAPLALTEKSHAQIGLDKASGKEHGEIATQYGVAKGIVQKSVREKFVSNREGRETLKGVLLENAIAFGSQASEKIEELNGMQSVVAAGIMTQRYIDLDKHSSTVVDNADLDQIASVGRTIAELEGMASSVGEEVGEIIDITADVMTGQ